MAKTSSKGSRSSKDYYAAREFPEAKVIIIAVGVSVVVAVLAFLVWDLFNGLPPARHF